VLTPGVGNAWKGNYGPLRELAKKSPAGFITGFGGRTSATDGTHMPEPQMYAIMDMTPEERLVSCCHIAAFWVAFFSRWQRYRC